MLHNNTGLDFFVTINPHNDIYDGLPLALKDAIDAIQYARAIPYTAPLLNFMDLPPMSQDQRQRREERQRSAHHILSESFPLVQAAIVELGRDEVRRISYDKTYDRPYQFRSNYFDALKEKLADAYMLDTTKTHLRQYLDHKLGADLGL